MPSYKVKSPIEHDGKQYNVGDSVQLTEEQAAAMPHAVEQGQGQNDRIPLDKLEKPGDPKDKGKRA